MPDLVDLQAKVNAAWGEFEQALGDALPSLPAGALLSLQPDYSVLRAQKGYTVTVTVTVAGGRLVASAATYAMHLPGHQMDRAALADMAGRGWSAPADVSGWEWWFRVTATVNETARLATILTRTLREVSCVPHPAYVIPEYIDASGTVTWPPWLGAAGVTRAAETLLTDFRNLLVLQDPPELNSAALRERVRTVLAVAKQVRPELVAVDADGEMAVRVGAAMVFLRVRDDPLRVDLFCPLLTDLAPSARSSDSLSRLAGGLRTGQSLHAGPTVWAVTTEPGHDFQPGRLVQAVRKLVEFADEVTPRLRRELGGRAPFGERHGGGAIGKLSRPVAAVPGTPPASYEVSQREAASGPSAPYPAAPQAGYGYPPPAAPAPRKGRAGWMRWLRRTPGPGQPSPPPPSPPPSPPHYRPPMGSPEPSTGVGAIPPVDAEPASPPPSPGSRVYASSQLRYLATEMPNRVALAAEFSAVVRVVCQPDDLPHAVATPLSGFRVPEDGARVTVVVQAPHSLAPLTELEQVIAVPADGDSAPVRFGFQARGIGLHRLHLTAWAGGTFLAELALEVSVEVSAPYPDSPTKRVPLGPVRAEPDEVTLQVRYDGQRYTFQLLSDSYLFEPVLAEALTADPGDAVERTIATLRSIAAGSSGYTGGTARRWLEETGVGLWNDLVPEAVKEQFFQLRTHIASFTIATGGDVVPWELLYPLSRDYDEGFLVEQFPVLRRVYGQPRFLTISIADARYVVPAGSPANAQHEIAAIQRIVDRTSAPPRVLDDLERLLRLIDSGSCGMLHFACHNTFDPARGGSVLSLSGGPFVPGLLNRAVTRSALAGRHPLIFINACRSAGAVPEYARMTGWAQQFMAAGAGAFVGTLWAVRDEGAGRFAEAFYGALRDGQQLGEATRAARRHAGQDSTDPTWLAYTVYGSPTASVAG
jgi:hypothetical protein